MTKQLLPKGFDTMNKKARTDMKNQAKKERAAIPAVLACLILLLLPSRALADAGNALQFDGIDDYVELAVFDPGDEYTIELWVNPSSTADGQTFIGKHGVNGENHFVLGFRSGKLKLNMADNDQSIGDSFTGWHHLSIIVEELGSDSHVVVFMDNVVKWRGVFERNFGVTS